MQMHGASALWRLESVDWARLKHAYGPASDVPALLRTIALGGKSQITVAGNDLANLVNHQGSLYSASGPTAEAMLDLLAAVPVDTISARDLDRALVLLDGLGGMAQSADGDRVQRGLSPGDWAEALAQDTRNLSARDRTDALALGVMPEVLYTTYRAIADRLDVVLPWLDRLEAQVAALGVLSAMSAEAGQLMAPLRALLNASTDARVLRKALQVLARFASSPEAVPVAKPVQPFLAADAPLVLRVEAALAVPETRDATPVLLAALNDATPLYETDRADRLDSSWIVERAARALPGRTETETLLDALELAIHSAGAARAAPDGLVETALRAVLPGHRLAKQHFANRPPRSLTHDERRALSLVLLAVRQQTYAIWQLDWVGLPKRPDDLAQYLRPPGLLARLMRR